MIYSLVNDIVLTLFQIYVFWLSVKYFLLYKCTKSRNEEILELYWVCISVNRNREKDVCFLFSNQYQKKRVKAINIEYLQNVSLFYWQKRV